MTDQHRYDVVGFAGNEVVRTPNLDRLAETGVIFDNCYTPSPICMPGRACMMSGQYSSTNNVKEYFDDLPTGYPTFPKAFAENDYQTVCCGKLHHHYIDQGQGFLRLIGMHENIDEHQTKEFCQKNNINLGWGPVKEIKRSGIGLGRAITHDDYSVLGAKNYIEEYFCDPYYDRAIGDVRPIMLKVSLEQPHQPFFTDEERFNYYLNRVPIFTDSPLDHPELNMHPINLGNDVSERELRRATAAYYGMVENCDVLFGEVISALENAGQNIDDWVVVFCSDHGDMLGQHGTQAKGCFYEGSVRVPMFIRWPKGFAGGKRINQNVNTIDLFASLCELVDLPVPEGLDSRSLVPLLNGDTAKWDNATVSQFFCGGKPNTMVKRDDLKYQYYGPGDEVLFDLKKDPGETTNLISEPEYQEILDSFREKLVYLQG